MNVDEGRSIRANGISLYVEDHGSGTPVLLIHGWPDSAFVWRNQIPFLVANGFRVIAPAGTLGPPAGGGLVRAAPRGRRHDRGS